MERIQLKQQNDRFLETIRKTHTDWEQDKEFSKIAKKMEKGKNLKKMNLPKYTGHSGKKDTSISDENCCLPT